MAKIVDISLDGIFNGLGDVGNLFKDIREAITGKAIEDPTKRMELEGKLLKVEHLLTKAQTDVNAIEATHPSTFVAGWRPGCGWICVFGIGMEVILRPIVQWVMIVAGSELALPHIPISVLTTLLMGMLGLGGLRTYEGLKGVKRTMWGMKTKGTK